MLVCCVTATDDTYCPLLLSAQAAERNVFQHQIRDRIDLQIEIVSSTYVTSEIFERYVDTVLIQAVKAKGQRSGCIMKPAILFCDNCSAHMLDSILRKMTLHGILVWTSPPHTSQIFQILDFLLFCFVKRSKKHQMRNDSLPFNVDHILRLFRAYKSIMGSVTIRTAWSYAGFEYENRDMTIDLSANKQKIWMSPDFREVWELDYHENQLSARRHPHEWGWIDEHLFRRTERTIPEA
jgi:hypothetical protein